MTYRKPIYPLKKPLKIITDFEGLPVGAQELGRVIDNTSRERQYIFVKQDQHLSVIKTQKAGPNNQRFYHQFDFPLRVLSWFPETLDYFVKPPADGGPHAGAMITEDINVDNEMLAVGRNTDGYYILNRSRNSEKDDQYYTPVELNLSESLLYDQGLMDLWNSIAEKYKKGELQ